ncbi:dephospho-CoA kinase [Cellulomonas sp. RIT-PI-Y]|uniref:dephospho-CoA kinase n=1 Tax=Cellulomonas sp. RIT-PI-Y TaxID=3035297 RepID=UPI0021DA8E49|nr:dephospho-CoA kinase [Cellulomonas sp. RIT-PI-Y]
MQRIGLTGGIAAGKSVAAARLAELGAVVIDYDLLSREAVAIGTAGLEEVVAAFGPGVLAADGGLDRPALGRIVFADAAARTRLNHIVHPIVHRLAAEREAAAAAADPDAVVVHDIPLLAESGRDDSFHLVVAVLAGVELRVDRLVQGRGLSEADARDRIDAQVGDDARTAVADVLLDGNGSPDGLREQVDGLWVRLLEERDEERA